MAYEFDDEKLKKEADSVNSQKRALSVLGGIGDILSSGNSTGNYMLGQLNENKGTISNNFAKVADTLEDPYARNERAFQGMKRKDDATKMGDERTLLAEKKDPNSAKSKALKALAPRWGIQATPEMSAYDIEQMIDPRKMMETEATAKASFGNQLALQNNANKNSQILKGMDVRQESMRNDREKAEKASLLADKLATPYGSANTEDDAKKLKEAFETKRSFDGKLAEMIKLREKHGGGATMNREDVARGKSLSNDLLLAYKNMQTLGVLSQSDMNIVNAIIPEDPLEYNSPLAAMQGQDPILSRMKKFAADSEDDFKTKVGTRTRAGVNKIATEAPRTQIPVENPILQHAAGAAAELERRRASKKTTVSN